MLGQVSTAKMKLVGAVLLQLQKVLVLKALLSPSA